MAYYGEDLKDIWSLLDSGSGGKPQGYDVDMNREIGKGDAFTQMMAMLDQQDRQEQQAYDQNKPRRMVQGVLQALSNAGARANNQPGQRLAFGSDRPGTSGTNDIRKEVYKAMLKEKMGVDADRVPGAKTPESLQIFDRFRNDPAGAKQYQGFMQGLKPAPSAAEKLSSGVQEFFDVHGRMPKTPDEYIAWRQSNRPANAMEMFYYNELPPALKQQYDAARGRGGRNNDPLQLRTSHQ